MSNPVLAAPANAMSAPMSEQDAIWSRITWRIVPIVLVAYVMAFLDRINVGYAKLTMQQDLQFSDEVYGLGGGWKRSERGGPCCASWCCGAWPPPPRPG